MPFCVVERAVLHFETARFADPNGAFCKHYVAVSQHADSQMVGSPQVLFFIPRRYFDFVLILSADIYCRDFDGYCLFTGMDGWLRCESACETERTDIQPKSQFGFCIYASTLQCKQISALALCVAALGHTPQQAACHGDVAGVCERGFCFRC